MKKILLMTLALMACAGAAMADHIGVYADTQGFWCEVSTLAPPPANNSVYVIHKFNGNGSSALQFKVLDNSGLFFANASFNPSFLVLGTYNTDLSISYTQCLFGDVLVGTLNFFWFGNPISGCNNTLIVVAAPTSPIPGEIATVECDFATLTPASGGALFFTKSGLETIALPVAMPARTASCECASLCCTIATEENTWGGVKALYR